MDLKPIYDDFSEVTPDSLASMRERISKAAELILPGVRSNIIMFIIIIIIMIRLDMLGYGCTSASAVLGEEVVFSQLASRYHHDFDTNDDDDDQDSDDNDDDQQCSVKRLFSHSLHQGIVFIQTFL